MTGEPPQSDIDGILEFIKARKLLGHARHPVNCTCIQCGITYPAVSNVHATCGQPYDNHAMLGVAPVCPA